MSISVLIFFVLMHQDSERLHDKTELQESNRVFHSRAIDNLVRYSKQLSVELGEMQGTAPPKSQVRMAHHPKTSPPNRFLVMSRRTLNQVQTVYHSIVGQLSHTVCAIPVQTYKLGTNPKVVQVFEKLKQVPGSVQKALSSVVDETVVLPVTLPAMESLDFIKKQAKGLPYLPGKVLTSVKTAFHQVLDRALPVPPPSQLQVAEFSAAPYISAIHTIASRAMNSVHAAAHRLKSYQSSPPVIVAKPAPVETDVVTDARKLIEAGNVKAARILLQSAFEVVPSEEIRLWLGKTCFMLQDHNGATQYLSWFKRQSPYYPEAHAVLREINEGYRKWNRLNESIQISSRVVENSFFQAGWSEIVMPTEDIREITTRVASEVSLKSNLQLGKDPKARYQAKLIIIALKHSQFFFKDNTVFVSVPLIFKRMDINLVTKVLQIELEKRVRPEIKAIVVQWVNSDGQMLENHYYRSEAEQRFISRLVLLNGREIHSGQPSKDQDTALQAFQEQAVY